MDWNFLFATSCRCYHSQNDGHILFEGRKLPPRIKARERDSTLNHVILLAESGFDELLHAAIETLALITNLHTFFGHAVRISYNRYRHFGLCSDSVSFFVHFNINHSDRLEAE